MRLLYTTILYLLTPLVLLRLAVRGLRAPAYFRRWPERFGFVAPTTGPRPVWVHAVSVGEVQAAAPVVRALRERHPDIPVLVTTTTPTGTARVRALFGDDVSHCYLPYDLPGAVGRFLVRTRPRLALIMETELWPNLFRGCHDRGVPVLVLNARLSERSAAGYRKVGSLTRATLRDTTLIAAQSQADADRLTGLGADPARVRVTGSIKFDVRIPASAREQADVLRRQWGVDRPVWIAASVHEREDESVLTAFAQVRHVLPDALLMLVPRHPERFQRVAALAQRAGWQTVLRSTGEPCGPDTAVFVGDTMGELPLFCAAADVAFVGGSLVPHGGQNPLEPAALGVPVVFGPHTFNFAEISRMLLEAGAARRVTDHEELATVVLDWLRDATRRNTAGEQGRQVVERNRGAIETVMGLVEAHLVGGGAGQKA